MASERTAHPLNAAGPFYVEDGCCLRCGVPFVTAPDLFGQDDDGYCFVKHQPATKDELERAVETLQSQELTCIRYRGRDPEMRKRLSELGEGDLCDELEACEEPAAAEADKTTPDHVTFETRDPADGSFRAVDLARVLMEHLRRESAEQISQGSGLGYRFTGLSHDGGSARFAWSRYKDHFHRIEVVKLEQRSYCWLVRHSPLERPYDPEGPDRSDEFTSRRYVSIIIDDWLRSDERFSGIRWYFERDWRAGGSCLDRPW